MAVVLRDVGQYIQGAGELDNLGKFVKNWAISSCSSVPPIINGASATASKQPSRA